MTPPGSDVPDFALRPPNLNTLHEINKLPINMHYSGDDYVSKLQRVINVVHVRERLYVWFHLGMRYFIVEIKVACRTYRHAPGQRRTVTDQNDLKGLHWERHGGYVQCPCQREQGSLAMPGR
jgi:hypothetical protein